MQAAVTWEPDGSFDVRDDVDRRPVGDHEVVVRIRAAGVCQTDISLARGAFGQTTPVVLGHEGAGEVVEVGRAVVDRAVGDRVVLSWVPPCGGCYFCVRGEPHLCANRKRASEQGSGADLTVDGRPVQHGMGTATFAEETVVPAAAAVPIPDDLPFELAALLGCAVPTGFGAAASNAVIRSARPCTATNRLPANGSTGSPPGNHGARPTTPRTRSSSATVTAVRAPIEGPRSTTGSSPRSSRTRASAHRASGTGEGSSAWPWFQPVTR